MIGSFDRTGFRIHRRYFREGDLQVDLAGRTCLVTGGSSGLGLATARALAERGARVHMLSRDPARGEAARAAVAAETGNPDVSFTALDMTDLDAVRAFGEGWRGDVHVLVHNAGLLPERRTLTPQGLEITFAVHVAGPHLLTRSLRPRLEAAGDARVVFVSSGGMYTRSLSLEDLHWETRPYNGALAYADTKRMQVALAELWARHLGPGGVAVYSMHPGWADTPGVRASLPKFHRLLGPLLRTPEEGADTIVWLAVVQPAPEPRGAFWFDRRPRRVRVFPWTTQKEDEARRLWDLCESLSV